MTIIKHSILCFACLCTPDVALAAPANAAKADEVKAVHTVQDAIDHLAGRAENPHPPVPASPQGDWVTTSDYPPQALREDIEGITRFSLTVSEKGQVLNCTITQTSGSDLLDVTTCELMRLRASFKPATNPRGKPVGGIFQSSVRWNIPDDSDAPKPREHVYSVIFEKDGSVSNCQIERADGMPADEPKVGPVTCKPNTIEPYRDKDGNPVRKLVRFRSTVQVLDAPE